VLRKDVCVQQASSVSPKSLANLRPGAPPGNLNAYKHGRTSRQLRTHRGHIRALSELTSGASRPNVLEYAVALRWSRQDRAVLEIAVAKMAVLVSHHIALADALAAGDQPPDPPDLHVSRIEHFLYRRYVDQRRALAGTSFDENADAPAESARLARQLLSDWLLASDVLGPDAPEAFGLAAAAARLEVKTANSTKTTKTTNSAKTMETIPPQEAA
jgi:hypothetical protein